VSCYDMLGVAPTATRAEIASAYRRLAKALHPDAHPSASGAEQRVRLLAMVRLNLAYEACQRGVASTLSARARAEPPIAGTPTGRCDLCGATAHVRCHVDLQSAWMSSAIRPAPELELCIPCARALEVGMDVPDPPGRVGPVEASVATEGSDGSSPPRPRRVPWWVAAMMAVAAALVLFVVGVPRGATPVVLTGTCVQWSGGYSRASCDQAHAGKIVGTATNPDGCAARSSFFRYDSRVYCIDTSQ
jgi:hypothetical protein